MQFHQRLNPSNQLVIETAALSEVVETAEDTVVTSDGAPRYGDDSAPDSVAPSARAKRSGFRRTQSQESHHYTAESELLDLIGEAA